MVRWTIHVTADGPNVYDLARLSCSHVGKHSLCETDEGEDIDLIGALDAVEWNIKESTCVGAVSGHVDYVS